MLLTTLGIVPISSEHISFVKFCEIPEEFKLVVHSFSNGGYRIDKSKSRQKYSWKINPKVFTFTLLSLICQQQTREGPSLMYYQRINDEMCHMHGNTHLCLKF